MTMVEAAHKFLSVGYSVIPVRDNKRPTVKWEPFQNQRMPDADADRLFGTAWGIAVLCGPISGHLEVLDFDAKNYPKDRDFYEEWLALIDEFSPGLAPKLTVLSKTPSGGWHVPYRCLDGCDRNKKLAMALVHENIPPQVAIETRGTNGYVVAYPSPGYTMSKGTWGTVPIISGEERDVLLSCARMLSEVVDKPYTAPGPQELRRPGDDFNRNHSWADVLAPHGWRLARESGGEGYWTRPGKRVSDGTSATTNYKGSDLLKVFSSNAHPFEPDCTYSKFYCYALLEYGGNMVEAARSLGKAGYGDQRNPTNAQKPAPMVGTDADRRPQGWTKASDVQVKKMEWLWEPYIPMGEITFLAGEPGVGKSTVAQAIATQTTLGAEILGKAIPKGPVVFMSAEQSREHVTVPRFQDLGADLDMITLPDEEDAQGDLHPYVLDSSGIAELRAVCEGLRPSLIVVDTVTAYFEAARDFNTANQVREWMRRLNSIARSVGCAVLVLGHTNKATGQKAIHRISGSVDFVGASRSVLMAGSDPDDPRVRGLAHVKSNVGPIGRGMGFTVEDGVFGWTGYSELDADRMCEQPQAREAKERRSECEEWLRSVLEPGPRGAKEMERLAKAEGYSRRTLFDAKKSLGVASERDRFGAEGSWQWRLVGGEKTAQPWWEGK